MLSMLPLPYALQRFQQFYLGEFPRQVKNVGKPKKYLTAIKLPSGLLIKSNNLFYTLCGAYAYVRGA
jgi:hypothetical protein